MAEDLMMGFKFYDREDNMQKDADIWEVSDRLFSESMFDSIGKTAEDAKIAESFDAAHDIGPLDGLANFDFTEGFDFIL
ncbi:MAG: hypothetical protein LJE68_13715 [Rhodobacter sp.]|jgi:hypothetical protein|nr:hypothetical protein [Rhodobacter sp.]